VQYLPSDRLELVDTPTRLLEKPKDNVVRRLIAPMYVLSKDGSLISARENV
jgi:hypothetical protein